MLYVDITLLDILLCLDITILDILRYLVDLAPEGHKVAVRHLNAFETDIAIVLRWLKATHCTG